MQALLAAGLSGQAPVRYAAADCLRSLGNVLPSRASFLANQCMDRMNKHRSSPDAVHGAGSVLMSACMNTHTHTHTHTHTYIRAHAHIHIHSHMHALDIHTCTCTTTCVLFVRYLLAAVIGGSAASSLGLPHELSSSILNLGQQLSRSTPGGKKKEAPAAVC